jgi:hypothetical protein
MQQNLSKLLATHRLLYEPDNNHQDAPASTAGDDLSNDRANVEPTSGGSTCSRSGAGPEDGTDDLRTNAAANHTCDAVADHSEVELLQQRSSDVAACCSRDKLDYQTYCTALHD